MFCHKKIFIDEKNKLFIKDNMFYKEFKSNLKQVKSYTIQIVQNAAIKLEELELLKQQVGELISNAIKHGNKEDKNKKIKVWFACDKEKARIIVEDDGEGFQDIEKWNDFNKKRIEFLNKKQFDEVKPFLFYRNEYSKEEDGGNGLFAALEYWNNGIVFNNKKNTVAALRVFP